MPQEITDELIVEVCTPSSGDHKPPVYFFNKWISSHDVTCTCGRKMILEQWEDEFGLHVLLKEERSVR